MELNGTGLVLEGGGLRGVYTSGVLRFFMEKELWFPYVIGVSMGACNAANYISKQPERNRIVNIRYVNDPRYLSYVRLLTKGELFGMDFIYKTIPFDLVPFDFDTFQKNSQKCITAVTDCFSGEPVYFEKNDIGDDYFEILKASTSLPFISKPIHYNGRIFMDGGISDSIPIRKSMADGNKKNVLILTQPRDYKKSQEKLTKYSTLFYSRYKGLCTALANRHIRYNETMDLINQLESNGNVFVIRPQHALNVGRAERNKDKLYNTYDVGYSDASKTYNDLCSYLDK